MIAERAFGNLLNNEGEVVTSLGLVRKIQRDLSTGTQSCWHGLQLLTLRDNVPFKQYTVKSLYCNSSQAVPTKHEHASACGVIGKL